MFEKNSEKDVVTDKIGNLTIKDNLNSKHRDISAPTTVSYVKDSSNDFHTQAQAKTDLNQEFHTGGQTKTDLSQVLKTGNLPLENESVLHNESPTKVYKSNINKFNFLQTQLVSDNLDNTKSVEVLNSPKEELNNEDCSGNTCKNDIIEKACENDMPDAQKEEINVTDDLRLVREHSLSSTVDITPTVNNTSTVDNTPVEKNENSKHEQEPEVSISVPPRRKKHQPFPDKVAVTNVMKHTDKPPVKNYPDHLNPFSDNEDEEVIIIPLREFNVLLFYTNKFKKTCPTIFLG